MCVITDLSLTEVEVLDIESIEIVKGAAGAQLYGPRAANGLVQIRTKKDVRRQDENREDAEDAKGWVTGTVLHPATGEPLPNVQVFIKELNMGGLANNQGRFLLLNVAAGLRPNMARWGKRYKMRPCVSGSSN